MDPMAELKDEGARARRLVDDVGRLWADVEETRGFLGGVVRRRVQQNPLGSLAAAAFAGYVLGGGLAAPLTRVMMRAGTRVLLATMVRNQIYAGAASRPAATQMQH